MKRRMKIVEKQRCMLLIALLITIMCGSVVSAAVNNKVLALNDTYVEGRIKINGDVDRYKITTTLPGTLTVSVQGWDIGDMYYQLLNETLDSDKEFYKAEIWSTTAESPKTSTQVKILEKGTYYLNIWPYGDHLGKYRVKASFSAAGNNETEPNNSFDTAMYLSAKKTVTGLISVQDQVDFYRINVPSGQKVTVTYQARIGDSYYSIWDKDFVQQKRTEVWGASEETPKSSTYEETLAAGIWYLKVEPYGSNTGRYLLKWDGENVKAEPDPTPTPAPTPSPAPSTLVKVKKIAFKGATMIVGKKKQLAVTVTPSNASNKKLIYVSSDKSIASVSTTGVVKARKPGKVTITAAAADGSGVMTSKTFYVKPKQMAKPSTSSAKKKKVVVKWKKAAGVSGYQICWSRSKSFAEYSMKKVGASKTSATLKSLTSKKKYYIRIRAYVKAGSKTLYGKWSTVAARKCK